MDDGGVFISFFMLLAIAPLLYLLGLVLIEIASSYDEQRHNRRSDHERTVREITEHIELIGSIARANEERREAERREAEQRETERRLREELDAMMEKMNDVRPDMLSRSVHSESELGGIEPATDSRTTVQKRIDNLEL